MSWIGSYTIEELLDSFLEPPHYRPPESNGVYLVSKKAWVTCPTKECIPLYVGSNTGKSKRFRTRIGDLIADMFGFFGEETAHHSGGKSLNKYCKENSLNPKKLYIGWFRDCSCVKCTENELYEDLKPCLNKNRPHKCNDHRPVPSGRSG